MQTPRIPGLYGPIASGLMLLGTICASCLILLSPLLELVTQNKSLSVFLVSSGALGLFWLLSRITDQAKLLRKQPVIPPISTSAWPHILMLSLLALEILLWAWVAVKNIPTHKPAFLLCHSIVFFIIVIRAVYMALSTHNDTLVIHGLVAHNTPATVNA